MTIPRSVIQQAFPDQPRMQAAFETLVSDADDAIARLTTAIAAIGDLSGGAADIVAELAQKQPKNDTLSAISGISADPGAIEQTGAGTVAIRPIDAADTRSLLSRAVADTRYLGKTKAATTADKLTTARSIAITGDVVWSVTFDGSSNVTAAGTIQANAVSFSKLVGATQKALIGANAAGNFQEITLGTGISLVAGVLSATGTGGSVTSVSVVTANGVSGSVANPSTTPAITLTLGAITPSSVAATGAVTGSNLSGTNTGDQTSVSGNAGTATKLATARSISITGDVAWTIASFDGSANVTAAGTLATVNANTGSWGSATQVAQITLDGKGRATAAANVTITPAVGSITGLGTGVATFLATPSSANLVAAITDETGSGALVFGTTPTLATPVINGLPTGTGVAATSTASTLAARDANKNLLANNYLADYTTTATAVGTTTLTVASTYLQFFTGSTTQTITLPVASTMALGQQFQIFNLSTGAVTVNSSGGSAVVVLAGGSAATITCVLASGTGTGSWSVGYWGTTVASGKLLTASNTLTFTGTDGSSVAFGAGGTALFSGGALGTPSSGALTNCTFPTLNQSTTGSAATLTTSRNIDGQAFNGSADITVIAPGAHAATSKTTPVDADELPLVDSAASNVLKKLTWSNLKATLKAYFDTLYQVLNSNLTTIAGLTATTDNFIVSVSSAWASRTPSQVRATLGFGSTGYTTATSFPGSPASGDMCYRTDRAIEYYYDGTRWLSTQIHFVPIPNTDFVLPRTATTLGMCRAANPWAGLYAIYAVDAVFHNFITATSTWTLAIIDNDATTPTTLATRSTSGDAANTHLSNRVTVNAVVASTVDNLQGEVTLVSGAASLYCSFGLTYRLIG